MIRHNAYSSFSSCQENLFKGQNVSAESGRRVTTDDFSKKLKFSFLSSLDVDFPSKSYNQQSNCYQFGEKRDEVSAAIF